MATTNQRKLTPVEVLAIISILTAILLTVLSQAKAKEEFGEHGAMFSVPAIRLDLASTR